MYILSANTPDEITKCEEKLVCGLRDDASAMTENLRVSWDATGAATTRDPPKKLLHAATSQKTLSQEIQRLGESWMYTFTPNVAGHPGKSQELVNCAPVVNCQHQQFGR